MRSRFLSGGSVGLVAGTALAACAASASGAAFVQVNQVGFASGAPAKRALLMSSASEAGAVYRVVNVATGATALSGAVPAPIGAWAAGYRFVYPLAFSALSSAGSYRVSVSGPQPANSASFRIGAAAQLYDPLIADAEQLYLAQRDGPGATGAPLGNVPAHLTDEKAFTYLSPTVDPNGFLNGSPPLQRISSTTIDASGGWRDAGDNLKFLDVASVGEYELLFGLANYPVASSAASLSAEAKYGLDWLQKMWNDNTGTLYYQVGITDGTANGSIQGDHTMFVLPSAQDQLGIPVTRTSDPQYYIEYRPVLRANPPGGLTVHNVSPNLAGRMAADLALCYRLFRASNQTYANTCLKSAEDVFAKANTSPASLVQRLAGGGETIWHDDMELGATELYLALAPGHLPPGLPQTNPLVYLSAAANWARAYINNDSVPTRSGCSGPVGDCYSNSLDEGDLGGLAHYELVRALAQAGNPSGLAVTGSQLVTDLKARIDFWRSLAANGFTSPSAPHPFGNAYRFDDETVVHDFGLAVLAALYHKLTGDPSEAVFAQQQIDYNLGANPWGLSFVIGAGTNWPYCEHHALANINGSLNGLRGGKGILAGGVVTGPNVEALTPTTNIPGGNFCDRVSAPGVPPFTSFNALEDSIQGNYQDFYGDYWRNEPQTDWTAVTALAYESQIGS